MAARPRARHDGARGAAPATSGAAAGAAAVQDCSAPNAFFMLSSGSHAPPDPAAASAASCAAAVQSSCAGIGGDTAPAMLDWARNPKLLREAPTKYVQDVAPALLQHLLPGNCSVQCTVRTPRIRLISQLVLHITDFATVGFQSKYAKRDVSCRGCIPRTPTTPAAHARRRLLGAHRSGCARAVLWTCAGAVAAAWRCRRRAAAAWPWAGLLLPSHHHSLCIRWRCLCDAPLHACSRPAGLPAPPAEVAVDTGALRRPRGPSTRWLHFARTSWLPSRRCGARMQHYTHQTSASGVPRICYRAPNMLYMFSYAVTCYNET